MCINKNIPEIQLSTFNSETCLEALILPLKSIITINPDKLWIKHKKLFKSHTEACELKTSFLLIQSTEYLSISIRALSLKNYFPPIHDLIVLLF